MVEHANRHANAEHAALHVSDAGRRPRHFEPRLELIGDGEAAIDDRRLEIDRALFTASVDEPRLAVIVLRQSPLPAVGSGGFLQDAGRRPSDPERVVGAVDPVVHRPDEAALLVLEVPLAACAGEKQFLLLRHPVAVVSVYL